VERIDQRASANQRDAIDDAWVAADAACALLGVKRQTLYAYASRGLVRSIARGGRERLYRTQDLERLRARSAARSGHAAVAAGALRWGEPVLDTALSSVAGGDLHYRGKSAAALARSGATFETVATWLWSATWEPRIRFAKAEAGIDVRTAARMVSRGAHPVDRLIAIAGMIACADAGRVVEDDAYASSLVRRLAALHGVGRVPASRIRRALTARTIAETVTLAAGVRGGPRAQRAVDVALVLMAEHELNASTFAARVAAGAGAELAACVAAGVATIAGIGHGKACDRVEALFDEAREPEDAARILRERRRRGDPVPAFGHPLYPNGDPRTAPMLEAAAALAPRNPVVRKAHAFVDAMALAGGEPPSIEIGLVAVAGALGMERGGGAALMALGRVAGWIAHAREQRAAGFTLRPRARYVGAAIEASVQSSAS
jgi:citrate synthase